MLSLHGIATRAGQGLYNASLGKGKRGVRTKVTMESIKALRERTGAPIKAVKEALEATANDAERAIEHLRKLGTALAAGRAHRRADDGLVAVALSTDGRAGSIVELSSETDFVARTPQFSSVAAALARSMLRAKDNIDDDNSVGSSEGRVDVPVDKVLDMDDARQRVADATTALGEKIALRRAAIVRVGSATGKGEATTKDGLVSGYVHRGPTADCGKVGVLVAIENAPDGKDLGRRVAMHVAAASPRYVSVGGIPPEHIDGERGILLQAAATEAVAAGKPKADDVLRRIVDGRLGKWLADVVLERQEMFVESNGYSGKPRSVAKALAEYAANARIVDFVRFEVGGS